MIQDICRQRNNVKTVLLLPESSKHTIISENDVNDFPFSMSLLFQCLYRMKIREDHETLFGDLQKQVSVVMMIYNLFKNKDMADFVSKTDFVITVPFTDENIVPEQKFIELAERVLINLEIGKCPQNI